MNAGIRRILVFVLVPMLVFASGCVGKSRSKNEARAAFVAGQREALSQFQQQQQAGPGTVRITGDVRHPVVSWTEGMTLSQAIVAAEYLGIRDPSEILILRNDTVLRVNPRDLLRGRDQPVEPGDRIELRR